MEFNGYKTKIIKQFKLLMITFREFETLLDALKLYKLKLRTYY